MRRFTTLLACALLLCVACSSAPNKSDDDGGTGGTGGIGGGGGAPDPQPLKLVTWNVKNLFDDQDDGEMFEEQDFQWEAHVTAVATVLNTIDADVIVLQEVEHTAVLGAVVAELDGAYLFHQVIDGNDPRGIDVGVISKIEPDELISHRMDSFSKVGTSSPNYRFARDALEVRLTFNGRRVVLLGVHYKAKENDDPDKRLAEAQRAREIADALTAEDPETGIVILGDFNDLPGSPPLDWSIGSEPDRYTSVADSVPEAERYTFNFGGKLELVDHLIANPLLTGMLDTSSVTIIHGPEVDNASDHAPVIATYDVF